MLGVEAGEGRPEHLDEVAVVAQVMVHVSEVGVDVVSVPAKRGRKMTLDVWGNADISYV